MKLSNVVKFAFASETSNSFYAPVKFAAVLLSIVILSGCATHRDCWGRYGGDGGIWCEMASIGKPSDTQDTQETKRDPGLYGVELWNGTTGSSDINGEVGHRLAVAGPRMTCVTDSGEGQSWNASYEILSGSLPPGMSVNDNFSISGLPTERGHWIVRMALKNISCGGEKYQLKDYLKEEELRFHITGSGRVVQ